MLPMKLLTGEAFVKIPSRVGTLYCVAFRLNGEDKPQLLRTLRISGDLLRSPATMMFLLGVDMIAAISEHALSSVCRLRSGLVWVGTYKLITSHSVFLIVTLECRMLAMSLSTRQWLIASGVIVTHPPFLFGGVNTFGAVFSEGWS